MIWNFIKHVWNDYFSDKTLKKQKRKCYWSIIKIAADQLWSFLSSWLIFAIYYMFRKPITNKLLKNGWEYDLQYAVDGVNAIEDNKKIKKTLGCFYYWLWSYSDEGVDPLGKGIVPDSYKPNVKSTFWRRYLWSGIRNPRTIKCHVYHRTEKKIVEEWLSNQTDLIDKYVDVYGFGKRQMNTEFKWYKNEDNKLYFYYHNVKGTKFLYFGFVDAYFKDKKQEYKRFECSSRSCEPI